MQYFTQYWKKRIVRMHYHTLVHKKVHFSVFIDIFFYFKCAKSKRLRKVLQLFYYTMVAI